MWRKTPVSPSPDPHSLPFLVCLFSTSEILSLVGESLMHHWQLLPPNISTQFETPNSHVTGVMKMHFDLLILLLHHWAKYLLLMSLLVSLMIQISITGRCVTLSSFVHVLMLIPSTMHFMLAGSGSSTHRFCPQLEHDTTMPCAGDFPTFSVLHASMTMSDQICFHECV